ncbi:MAG: TonB-dependent receptor [Sphingomonas sp.]|uniref:TonB-dependent receptor domain-containing protein n=1 Tax=Sphingomonas sp. TaxID=28214 RepID=UPI0025D3FA62|nr:TonB-dependent receptor [Sphingomonas sp.]MBY0284521.1 TonB-dependent receptor [Sphingomonas sp.]
MNSRITIRALLLAGATCCATSALAQTAESTAPAQAAPASAEDQDKADEVVVTGLTTRNRALITASADITYATAADIDRKAPRSTADLLELVPGIFVEGTAGELSNNYSVRGLQGGGQRFIQLEEDGLPIIYGGGGADFFFSNDITIDRLEAVKGGSSGVLTVNGAGATINFLSRTPNHTKAEGIARFTAYSFGQRRGDFYYSQPITDKLAFNIGGYIQTNPGVRSNPFSYDGYRLKAMLEYSFDGGGYIRLTGKIGDIKAAFYATQPYAYNNGQPSGIPGLDTQFGNVGGTAFSRISVPVSTFVEADGFRDFRYDQGVRVKTKQLRIDFEKPLSDSIDLFAHARYLGLTDDFNGLFPGSGTGNAGLASAVTYLTPGAASPISGLLAAGQAVFPTTVRFGIRNLRTGVVTGSNNTAALNALNGNGFLQQTTLNHDFQSGYDFGSNFGARWEYKGNGFTNSLTAGVLYYNVSRFQNQSATSAVVNDVRNNSDIYDIVALNAANGVIGTLTDNGQISYGNWGAGIRQSKDSSVSLYANDELTIGTKLHIDGGLRWESDSAEFRDGNSAAINQPVQPGLVNAAVVPTVGSTFNGTFTVTRRTNSRVAWTIGANYLLTDNLSLYARYANSFQTNGVNPITGVELYEAGVRYKYRRLLNASVTVFRTNFRDQFYNFIDPLNPTIQTTFLADLGTTGVEVDALIRPVDWFSIDFFGVFQGPTLNNLRLNGVPQPSFNGNRPERTPSTLFTITPTIKLPKKLGEFYGRYKYIGNIFADSGNGISLPAYGVTSFGVNVNVTEQLQVSVNADNVFNVIGLTEGNPRQGQTQNAASGFFYARGIVGPTYGGSVTLRF